MRFAPVLVLGTTLALPSVARGEDMTMGNASSASGIGVGVESILSGPTGPTVVYQTPSFHVSGLLGFRDDGDDTDITLAGRFFYQVHAGELADFNVGGGVGIVHRDDGDNADQDLHLEGGAKIRVFLAPNVALSSTLGLSLVPDGESAFTGQLQGTMGITYFFF